MAVAVGGRLILASRSSCFCFHVPLEAEESRLLLLLLLRPGSSSLLLFSFTALSFLKGISLCLGRAAVVGTTDDCEARHDAHSALFFAFSELLLLEYRATSTFWTASSFSKLVFLTMTDSENSFFFFFLSQVVLEQD